ncbi:MAG: LD-carboxypeptidase [Clostridia bacterium]|nr:LD-carboxypeptidase [Clostridia bacterium]
MIIPKGLNKGDKVAIVSLSWGGAGDGEIYNRYLTGKKRLEDVLGLEVVAMPHALKGSAYVSTHPEDRAKDWMDAFRDPTIKGIISNIGGNDTIRLLPYIDYEVISDNPKVFMGYSDTTVNHFMCYKAGLRSYYGPSVLMEFAENVAIHDYVVEGVMRTLFSNDVIGEVEGAKMWTSDYLPWDVAENNATQRKMLPETHGYEVLQGSGRVTGALMGGCIESVNDLRGTPLWPSLDEWQGKILFLESSEDKPSPEAVACMLRGFWATGIIDVINGILVGKPQGEVYYEDYKSVYKEVIGIQCGRPDLPILYNVNFGHASPITVLPYGALAEIDCDKKSFKILESGVL